jgi:arginyl-tRNA synthetase
MLAKAREAGIQPAAPGGDFLAALGTPEDLELCRQLERFPDVVAGAAQALAPHAVSHYLSELAAALHKYYTQHHVLSAGADVAAARLLLLSCVATTLAAGLDLLGVGAPERMDQVSDADAAAPEADA